MGPPGESERTQSFCGDLPCAVLFSPLCPLSMVSVPSKGKVISIINGVGAAERNIGFVRKGQIKSDLFG